MNNTLKYAIVLLFIYITTPFAYVLVMVDADYYNSSQLKVERFANDVMYYDGIPVSIYPLNTIGKTQFDVWFILRDLYAAAHGTGSPLEGVVMIGNVPPTVFYFEYDKCIIPSEYFYMDLWKGDAVPQRAYYSWDEPWDTWSGDPGIVYRESYGNGAGDKVLDIWVSRIYATNLNYLRAAGAAWGNFLEEYQILDNYLDRLHARMSAPSKVADSGFVLGGLPRGLNPLERCQLDKLNLKKVQIFNQSNLNLSQAAAWQAQLQNGPYGNINYGALNGVKFTDANYKRDCRTSYPQTYGYAWAAIDAHSLPVLNDLFQYSISNYAVGGYFGSVSMPSAWTKKTSGGYNNGTYYEWNLPFHGQALAEWSCVVPQGKGGDYKVEMYWNYQAGLNSPNSYYRLFGPHSTDPGSDFEILMENTLDQNSSAGWHPIGSIFHCWDLDSLVFRFEPNALGYTRKNRCVADAVRFTLVQAEAWSSNGVSYITGAFVSYNSIKYRCLRNHTSSTSRPPTNTYYWTTDASTYTITITPSNIFNISSRGTKGFRLTNWYTRSFCHMQDDGGQSKVPFYLIFGCFCGNYLIPENIGLLYGMGHEGLISMTNSSVLLGSFDFSSYTQSLGNGNNFGKAYLAQAQMAFTFPYWNYILFGAGTLYSEPY